MIFVLGAGASVPLGMPTTKSFLDGLCNDRTVGRTATEIRTSAAYRFRVGVDDINIEDFLQHVYELQLMVWFARRSSVPRLLPRFTGLSRIAASADQHLSELLESVFARLHESCGDCSGARVNEIWHPILQRASIVQPTIPIFTLNYDWTFEKLAIEHMRQYQLLDGFELLGGEWNPKRFSAKPSAKRINVSLFKLHGSTNWIGEGPTKSMGRFESGGFDMVYPGHAHEMALGDEYWSLSPDGGIDREPYKTLHDRFRESVREAELVVVIGYAFHDERVNDELLTQVNRRRTLKVLVVDPGIERYVRRTDSTHTDPPFEWLKFTHHGTRWSQFYWFEGYFGTPEAADAILNGIDRLLPRRPRSKRNPARVRVKRAAD